MPPASADTTFQVTETSVVPCRTVAVAPMFVQTYLCEAKSDQSLSDTPFGPRALFPDIP